MRPLLLLALLLPFAFAAPVAAKLDGPAWVEAEKQFHALFNEPGQPEKKADLIKTIVKDGEPRAWKLLADALLRESEHLSRVAESLSKDLNSLQVLLAKKVSEMYPRDREEMFRLQGVVSQEERDRAAEDKTLKAVIAAGVAANEDARKMMLAVGRGAKDWPARAAVARLAGSAPEESLSESVLAESLEKEKDPRVKLAALESLQTAPGTKWFHFVVARILDPDWQVQLMAARIAGAREMGGKAIPVLIQALAGCTPRVGEEIVASLRKLTGEAIDAYAEPWGKWWEANRTKWGEDGRPLQPVVSVPRPSDIEFYGLKIKSSRVMFIIDISASMKDEKQAPPAPPPPKGPTTGEPSKKPPEPTKFSGPKIEIAKQELRRALKALPKEALFDIIAFNHSVTQWMPKMQQATDPNKELAYAWIRDMAPSGSTYADGALRMAFKMAGMGAYDKAYPGVGVDTIIFLSDGAPTDNAVPMPHDMPPDEILQHVAEWNPQHRIIIHCVGIDNVVQGIEFMKKLAAQNGGTYVDG